MKELTPLHICNVARRLTKISDIRLLGLHLGIEDYKINGIIHNKREEIQEAVYEMLTHWRNGQKDCETAFANLWNTLINPTVNLSCIAREALLPYSEEQKDGTSTNSGGSPAGGVSTL